MKLFVSKQLCLFIENIVSSLKTAQSQRLVKKKGNYRLLKTTSEIQFIETDIYSFLLFRLFVLL